MASKILQDLGSAQFKSNFLCFSPSSLLMETCPQELHHSSSNWSDFSSDLRIFLLHLICDLHSDTRKSLLPSIPHLLVIIQHLVLFLCSTFHSYIYLIIQLMLNTLDLCPNPLTCRFHEIRGYMPLQFFTLFPVTRQQLSKRTQYTLVDKFGDATAKPFAYAN